jgi:hypothetical protein
MRKRLAAFVWAKTHVAAYAKASASTLSKRSRTPESREYDGTLALHKKER